MSETVAERILPSGPEWPPDLRPTINGWPAEQIPAEDPEANRLAGAIRFYWKANILLADLRSDAASPDDAAARLKQHLAGKGVLDDDLLRWAAFVEAELDDGYISNVLYTCPRAMWNPAICVYQATVLDVKFPGIGTNAD